MFITITDHKGKRYTRLIEEIMLIDPADIMEGHDVLRLKNGQAFVITNAERLRIEALLMPAPIESAAPMSPLLERVLVSYRKYKNTVARTDMWNSRFAELSFHLSEWEESLEGGSISHSKTPAPALPDVVMEWVKNLPSLESIGGNDTFEHLADITNILLDYMPKEAE